MSNPLKPRSSHKRCYDVVSLNLKYYRNKLQMTQVQVADQAGISAKYISILENDLFQNAPSMEVVFSLAEALQIEPFQLFKPLD